MDQQSEMKEIVKKMINGCGNLEEYQIVLNNTIDNVKLELLSNSAVMNANNLLKTYTAYSEDFRVFLKNTRNIIGDNPHLDLQSAKRNFCTGISQDSMVFENLADVQKGILDRDKKKKAGYEYLMEEQRRVGSIEHALTSLLGNSIKTEGVTFFQIFLKIYNSKNTGDEISNLFGELLS